MATKLSAAASSERGVFARLSPWLLLALVCWVIVGVLLERPWRSSDALTEAYAIGSMNGVKLSIPREYLFFPVEYLGESVWDPRKDKPKRTYDSKIGNFSVYVHWPTMRPRRPENETSYIKSFRDDPEDAFWMMVTLVTREFADPEMERRRQMRRAEMSTNGLAGVLRGHLDRPDRYGMPAAAKYERRGFNEALGLYSAIPVGPGTEYFHSWNRALYWAGDINGFIDTLIICQHGALRGPGTLDCTHFYELPRFDAYTRLRYRADLLPQWREIEAKTRELFEYFTLAEHIPPDILKDLQE